MIQAGDRFGVTTAGAAVEAIRIRAGVLTARVLTIGAILQEVRLEGMGHSLTLGSARLADYEGPMGYFGAIVGPVANRIGGARAVIAGREYRFAENEPGRTLHSGPEGTHAQVWQVDAATDAAVTLSLALPDGQGGFPGNRRIVARYEVLPPATLRLTITARTDADTLMNPAQHSYWNLDGSPHWRGHRLRIAADHVLPVDAGLLPRGSVVPAGGTPMDFRRERALREGAPPLDTNFCLSEGSVGLREVAWLTGATGVGMVLATTAPGLQVYDGRAAIRPGHEPHEGIALEPQHWPDAPNHPRFPSIALAGGEVFSQITEWRFSTPPAAALRQGVGR